MLQPGDAPEEPREGALGREAVQVRHLLGGLLGPVRFETPPEHPREVRPDEAEHEHERGADEQRSGAAAAAAAAAASAAAAAAADDGDDRHDDPPSPVDLNDVRLVFADLSYLIP